MEKSKHKEWLTQIVKSVVHRHLQLNVSEEEFESIAEELMKEWYAAPVELRPKILITLNDVGIDNISGNIDLDVISLDYFAKENNTNINGMDVGADFHSVYYMNDELLNGVFDMILNGINKNEEN